MRISEIFGSFQGEGRFVGKPTIFIRFFGCNLECNGFGQTDPTDPTTYVLPYKTIDISNVSNLEELPVFHHGCDSSYSWSSKYKHLAKDYTVEQVITKIVQICQTVYNIDLFKTKNFRFKDTNEEVQLCFTGGEPMLQQRSIFEICEALNNRFIEVPMITIETNGTVPLKNRTPLKYKPVYKDLLLVDLLDFSNHVHISCSPKLFAVSGEKDVVKLNTISSYMKICTSMDLKFVHNNTKQAWDELKFYKEQFKNYFEKPNSKCSISYFIMPCGSVVESQEQNYLSAMALEALANGFNISPRYHITVFGNNIGT